MTNLYEGAHKDGEVGQVVAGANSDVIRGRGNLATFRRPVPGAYSSVCVKDKGYTSNSL